MNYITYRVWFSNCSADVILALCPHDAVVLATADRIKDGLSVKIFKVEEKQKDGSFMEIFGEGFVKFVEER